MNGHPASPDDTARLISALVDGSLQGIERTRLELQLESDTAARRLYLQMINLEIELRCTTVPADDAGIVFLTSALAKQEVAQRRRRRRVVALLTIAAAAAMAAAVLLRPAVAPQPTAKTPIVAQTVAETWATDFEEGTSAGWTGKLVNNGLPAGSKFGIAAVPHVRPYGTFWVVEPPANWNAGFATLTPRSTLHITWRTGEPAARDVFLHTITGDPGPSGTEFGMYRLTNSQFPGKTGQWQTASIPVALFVRKVPGAAGGAPEFSGGPPAAGERVAALSFSAPHAIDLVIDSIRITADGPETETIRPAP